MSVYFHQFWPVMVIPRENQLGQQHTLVALCSELRRIHCPLAADDMHPACVRQCVDGSLWQIHVRRCGYNLAVVHLHLVAATDTRSEEDYLRGLGFTCVPSQIIIQFKFRKLYIFTRTITDAHGRLGGLYHHTDYHGCPQTTRRIILYNKKPLSAEWQRMDKPGKTGKKGLKHLSVRNVHTLHYCTKESKYPAVYR